MSNTPRTPKLPTPPVRGYYSRPPEDSAWWSDALLLLGLIAIVGSFTLILARCAGAQ